jgi:hypothetical protein
MPAPAPTAETRGRAAVEPYAAGPAPEVGPPNNEGGGWPPY